MGAANVIEQRWSQRRSVILGIEVFDHGSLISACQSRDVGLGGMFIETDKNQFKQNQDVELLFALGNENTVKHKLKARVVRVLNEGVGLVFKDFDTSSFRALQEIMRYSVSDKKD